MSRSLPAASVTVACGPRGQRLAAAHVGEDRAQLVRPAGPLDVLVRADAEALRLEDVRSVQLRVVRTDDAPARRCPRAAAGVTHAPLGRRRGCSSASNSSRLRPSLRYPRELRLVVVEGVHGVVLAGLDLGLARPRRAAAPRSTRAAPPAPCPAACTPCCIFFTRPSRSRRSARSSSRVSNSLASWANSSSASGSSRSLTRPHGDRHLGVLAGVVAGDQRGGERRRCRRPPRRPARRRCRRPAGRSRPRRTGPVVAPRRRPRRRRWPTGRWRRSRRPRPARSTPVSVPKRARSSSSCSSTSASVTSTSSTLTASSSKAGSAISGRTSTSAVNASVVAVLDLGDLDLRAGRARGPRPARRPRMYLAGMASLTTSSSTAPRPRRGSQHARRAPCPGGSPGCAPAGRACGRPGRSSASARRTAPRR